MTQQLIKTDSTNADSIKAAFNKVNANFTEVYEGKIDLSTLKEIVAASTDFADFKARIAAL